LKGYDKLAQDSLKVIIGAGKPSFDGWMSTQEDELNLLKTEDFERLFSPKVWMFFLAEHVWEHPDFSKAVTAAENLYRFLKPGGYARITVPDALFRNKWFHNMCKPGSPRPGGSPGLHPQGFL